MFVRRTRTSSWWPILFGMLLLAGAIPVLAQDAAPPAGHCPAAMKADAPPAGHCPAAMKADAPPAKDAGCAGALGGMNLTDEQKSQLDKMREEGRARQIEARKELMRARHELRGELLQDNPSKEKVRELARRIGEIETRMEIDRLESRLRMRDLLTPEQRNALIMRGDGMPGFGADDDREDRGFAWQGAPGNPGGPGCGGPCGQVRAFGPGGGPACCPGGSARQCCPEGMGHRGGDGGGSCCCSGPCCGMGGGGMAGSCCGMGGRSMGGPCMMGQGGQCGQGHMERGGRGCHGSGCAGGGHCQQGGQCMPGAQGCQGAQLQGGPGCGGMSQGGLGCGGQLQGGPGCGGMSQGGPACGGQSQKCMMGPGCSGKCQQGGQCQMGPGCGASGDWMARIGCGNQMSGRCSGGPMGQPWELRDASSKLDRVRVDRGCEMKCRIESMPGKCCPSQTECKGAPQGK